jgi:hypothetical protein
MRFFHRTGIDSGLITAHLPLHREQMEQPMSTPPFPPDQVADARRLVANLHLFLHYDEAELRQMRRTAWAILRADNDHRRLATRAATVTTQPGDAA